MLRSNLNTAQQRRPGQFRLSLNHVPACAHACAQVHWGVEKDMDAFNAFTENMRGDLDIHGPITLASFVDGAPSHRLLHRLLCHDTVTLTSSQGENLPVCVGHSMPCSMKPGGDGEKMPFVVHAHAVVLHEGSMKACSTTAWRLRLPCKRLGVTLDACRGVDAAGDRPAPGVGQGASPRERRARACEPALPGPQQGEQEEERGRPAHRVLSAPGAGTPYIPLGCSLHALP